MKTFKLILTGTLLASLAFCCGWFGHSLFGGKLKPSPTPTPIVTPIVNPDDSSPNQVVIEIGGTGTTSQTNQDKDETVQKKDSDNIGDVIHDITKIVTDHLPVSINKTMPVTGSITAKFIEKKTNTDLGSETRPLSGTATVQGDADNVNVKMDFNSELIFAVNVPKPALKLWSAGAYFEDDSDGSGWVYYGRRNFPIRINDKYSLIPYCEVQVGEEKELIGGFSLPLDFEKFTFQTYGQVEFGDENESIFGAEINW